MGNAALCAPSMISNNSSSVIKVLSSDGRLLIYSTREQLKAAEIMLENPGKFLCESTNLRVGQRIPGINAEEELERGQVYILLPMEMLYSVLTDEEIKSLRHKASKGMKAAAALSFSKIFPEFCLFPNNHHNNNNRTSSDDHYEYVEDLENVCIDYELKKTYSRQRSWEPSLETIVETSPPS